METSIAIIVQIFIILYSIILHEVAHGAVAERLGDDTAKHAGRLTLNPIPHIDPIGTILLPLITFFGAGAILGWARPVPYNHIALRGRYGELKVALAGPLTNFMIAFFFATLIRFDSAEVLEFSNFILGLFTYGVLLNVWLALFNLIPIPPLDGSKVLFLLIDKRNYALRAFLEQYGLILLIAFLFFGPAFLHPLAMFFTRALVGG